MDEFNEMKFINRFYCIKILQNKWYKIHGMLTFEKTQITNILLSCTKVALKYLVTQKISYK